MSLVVKRLAQHSAILFSILSGRYKPSGYSETIVAVLTQAGHPARRTELDSRAVHLVRCSIVHKQLPSRLSVFCGIQSCMVRPARHFSSLLFGHTDTMADAKSVSSTASSGKRKRGNQVAFYAVKVGRTPGIYQTWNEANQQVQGFPNPVCGYHCSSTSIMTC